MSIRELGRLGIPAAELGPDRKVAAANEALCEILGAGPPALLGADIAEALSAIAIPGETASGAYKIARGEDVAWYRLDMRVLNGGTVAILTDVSGEQRRLDDIRNFYTIRDRLLHDGKIGTWWYDPDGELYHFSSELTLGYDMAPAGVPCAALQIIQHPDDRTRDTEIRERITREGGYANAEMRYLANDGGWTHLDVHYRSGRKLPSGRYEMLGISQNITAVAVARDEANQISQRLNLALGAAQAGVFEYAYDKKAFWISPELVALLGEETLRKVGPEWPLLFAAADRDAAQAFFESAETAARAVSIELRLDRPAGPRWVRFYFDIKDRDQEGRPILGVGLLIDIDEHKRQEIALAEAQRAAEVANRSKTEFLANMSHELRTPLNAILGFSDVIERQMFGPVGDRYAGYARDIHRSGNHLLELINDVLDLSKLEAGKLELHEKDVVLDEVVEDCLALVRARAEAGQVTLKSELAPSLPPLRADARAVKQVLLNFLSNAVKFTPEGGKVIVRSWLAESGEICLSVRDTGIGMKPADVEVALSPFGQIDSMLARKHQGTGLGLPICKSLMDLHGGDLAVASKAGEGTTLTARFPAFRAVRAARSA